MAISVSDMTDHDVRKLLTAECKAARGQAAWAAKAKVSAAYVNDVLHERRDPGDAILRALGLERIVSYRRTSR